MADWQKHPLAFAEHCTSACGMNSGEPLRHISGRLCRVDEFLSDGEAFITFLDDGSWETVNWNTLRKE